MPIDQRNLHKKSTVYLEQQWRKSRFYQRNRYFELQSSFATNKNIQACNRDPYLRKSQLYIFVVMKLLYKHSCLSLSLYSLFLESRLINFLHSPISYLKFLNIPIFSNFSAFFSSLALNIFLIDYIIPNSYSNTSYDKNNMQIFSMKK